MQNIKSALLISGLLLLFGCNKTDSYSFQDDLDYYPVKLGNWIEYRVDSVGFSDIALPNIISDTQHYIIRETTVDTFYRTNNELAYKVEIKRKPDIDSAYSVSRIWWLTNNNNQIVKTENELSFIKLLFPLYDGLSWQGNQLINSQSAAHEEHEFYQNWDYTVEALDKPYLLESRTFERTLTVNQHDSDNLLERIFAIEIYAKNVGLIYKELQFLEKQNINASWDRPEKGFKISFTYLDSNIN